MPVSREKLYEEVWAEPMVTVAARYDVSSSFLARICTRLNVPRPSRGYWAQLEVGKADGKPPLPEPRAGDEIEWSREGPAKRLPPELPQAPVGKKRSLYPRGEKPDRHELLVGAREHFDDGKVLDSGYLRPAKRRLVDVFVSTGTLERALDVANALFLALESRGHHVTLTPANQYLVRPDLEVRSEGGKSVWSYTRWRPDRATVVFVGTVAIGLTLFEFTEEVAVQRVNGAYVRVPETLPGRRRAATVNSWVSKRDMPSGRLGFRASSPYSRTDWVRQWTETKGSDLSSKAEQIAREIDAAAPKVAALVEEAERQETIERTQREAAFVKWKREDAEQRRLQNIKESRADLLAAIDAWGAVRRIESFFEETERRAGTLAEEQAAAVRERVRRARTLIGEADALGRLLAWKAPEER